MIRAAHPVKRLLRGQLGFTLIEMMVALVLTGIVSTFLYQLMTSQSRLTHHQSKRESVQQNTRATLALLTSEFRTISRGALMSAAADSIRFRTPRVWGVVCGAVPGASAVDVLVPLTSAQYPVDASSRLVAGRRVGMVDQENWESTMTVTGVAASTGPTDAGVCVSPLPANTQRLRFTVAALPTSGVDAQDLAYFAEEISYRISDGWILRQRGSDVTQPFAGVVESLQLSYYQDDSTIPIVGTPTNLENVTRIGIKLHMRSQQKGAPVLQVDSTMVYLRNRV